MKPWKARLALGLSSSLAVLGLSRHEASAEGLAVSSASPQGSLTVASPPPQPTVEVAPATTSSTPLPVASEPAPSAAPQPAAAELQPAASPQPAAPSPQPAPEQPSAEPAPTSATVAQPAANPQATASTGEVQPASGGASEPTPPPAPEAPATATVTTPEPGPEEPALPVTSSPPQPEASVQSSTPAPSIQVTSSPPPAGTLQVAPPPPDSHPVSGNELQGGPTQAPSTPSPKPAGDATRSLQGSAPALQAPSDAGVRSAPTTSTSALQPSERPESLSPHSTVTPPTATGSGSRTTATASAPEPKSNDAICTTATFHDLVGGGARYCGGAKPSLVLIVGAGEGGSVSVERQSGQDQPSPSIHSDVSFGDGLASVGASSEIPLHGSPSVGASGTIAGVGPSVSLTRPDGTFNATFGVQGPLSAAKKKPARSHSAKQSAGAEGSVDLYVPVPWQYLQPDTLFTPVVGHHLYFGL